MKLLTKEVLLDNVSIEVSQENWDISMELMALQKEAADNPLDDKRQQHFRSQIWPYLVSCAAGDVPTFEDAYAMLETQPRDIDNWWIAVQEMTPRWFVNTNHNESETVTFSDNSKIMIVDGNVPSALMKYFDAELDAIENPVDSVKVQVFNMTFWPKMVACAVGEIPPRDEVRLWPSLDVNLWYEAAARVNPQWWDGIKELSEEAQKANQKKNRKRPRK